MRAKQYEMVSLDNLVVENHAYRRLKSLIDFTKITKSVGMVDSAVGAIGYTSKRLLMCLILQFMEDLSDREFERFIAENTARKWFCDFGITEKTPDYSTICKFRGILGEEGTSKVFEAVREQLVSKGYMSEVFTFIDATALTSKLTMWEECGKATFLHHDYDYYSNYRCSSKKYNHSMFTPKPTAISCPSMSKLFGKTNFKQMRYPVQTIITAITMFFIGKNSFRNIAEILRITMNIKVSHTTISNWCTRFAPLFHNIALEPIPMLNFDSDEWHADETVVKIKGKKYYIRFIVDSETRFVLGFHLSPHRNSPQAFSLLNSVKDLGTPASVVTDRYSAYNVPVKSVLQCNHIKVQSFQDAIFNNLIECFNKQFKAWYKTKQGFCSFESANNLISMFVFFFNFVRPHSALDGLTPAQVAGLNVSNKQKQKYLLVA